MRVNVVCASLSDCVWERIEHNVFIEYAVALVCAVALVYADAMTRRTGCHRHAETSVFARVSYSKVPYGSATSIAHKRSFVPPVSRNNVTSRGSLRKMARMHYAACRELKENTKTAAPRSRGWRLQR
jgi:hypothetical protein